MIKKNGDVTEQLRGLGDVAQLEVRDFSGEENVAGTIEQAAVAAVGAARQQAGGEVARACSRAKRIAAHEPRHTLATVRLAKNWLAFSAERQEQISISHE